MGKSPKKRSGKGFLESLQKLFIQIYGDPKGIFIFHGITKRCGGQYIEIPRIPKILKLLRNEQIQGKFTGNNYSQLSKEHDLSERQIRRVIHCRTNFNIDDIHDKDFFTLVTLFVAGPKAIPKCLPIDTRELLLITVEEIMSETYRMLDLPFPAAQSIIHP